MSTPEGSQGFRLRLRVRFAKALTSDEKELTFTFDDRDVAIKSQEKDQALREAKWVVFIARGFTSETDARAFGERLRTAVDVAGLCTCIGIDTGADKATTWMSEEFARELGLIKDNERLAPNVHGLSVYPDDDLTRVPSVNAEGVVTAQATGLLESLEELSRQRLSLGEVHTGVRLLNLAHMDNQPLARLVLSLSAVEALADDERWSAEQSTYIQNLADKVEEDAHRHTEIWEVADGIRKSLFKMSIRQKVKRLLRDLGLGALQRDWDRLYGLRSGVFHGSVVLDGSELNNLANETIKLCGKIILSMAQRDGLEVPSIARTHYFSAASKLEDPTSPSTNA